VSLADKLDTLVGLFAAGEKPTGSRDPFGLRRAAQGVMKILVDGGDLVASDRSPDLEALIDAALAGYGDRLQPADASWRPALFEFLAERAAHIFERRGFKADEARAVGSFWRRPHAALRRIEALAEARRSPEFLTLAGLFKRVKNITKGFDDGTLAPAVRAKLVEPAEVDLLGRIDARWPSIEEALRRQQYAQAMRELGALSQPVDRFFKDVLVMAEDRSLRDARLALLAALRDTVLNIADIAEIAPEDKTG
jgi:glycyl-tRNA synthetase beta chain